MRYARRVLLLCALAIAAAAAEPETAWQLDFDDAAGTGGVHYAVRGNAETTDGVLCKFRNGTLTFRAEFDDAGSGSDHGVLAWGESMPWGFWQWQSSPLPPIDAVRFPIVEFRARRVPAIDALLCLAPVFNTDSGRRFAQLQFKLTDDWQTFTFRYSPLSSTPVLSGARHLVGMAFWVQHNGRPSAFEIDWLRVRAFTPAEQAADRETVAILGSYQAPSWKQPFFVYGPYGPSIRGTACQGGLEGAYAGMVRAHMNYLACPHDLSYYRYQARPDRTQAENVADFIAANRRAVAAAAAVGLHMSLDVRGFAKDFNAHGLDAIRPGIRAVADAFRDNPTVLGYTVDDEPNTSRLVEVVAVKQLFEQADPARLCSFPLNDPYWVSDFEPYTTLVMADRYPITLDARNAESVAAQLDEYAALSPKPLWFVAQAIGQKDWWPRKSGNYAAPTEAEFRRMAFIALSRGAKGLLLFDWYHRPWQTLVDRYGNPEPLLDAAAKLGERLAAVGSVLLRARYNPESARLGTGTDTTTLEVLALELHEPRGLLCIVCNRDLKGDARTLAPEVPLPTADSVVLNLDSLEVSNGPMLRCANVAPGDGRFFAVVAAPDATRLQAEIRSNRKHETERAARPARLVAERWGTARETMRAIDADLRAAARQLGRIEKTVSSGVKVPKAGLEAQWQRCMDLAQTYDRLRRRWIEADSTGLAEQVRGLRADLAGLGNDMPAGQPENGP